MTKPQKTQNNETIKSIRQTFSEFELYQILHYGIMALYEEYRRQAHDFNYNNRPDIGLYLDEEIEKLLEVDKLLFQD